MKPAAPPLRRPAALRSVAVASRAHGVQQPRRARLAALALLVGLAACQTAGVSPTGPAPAASGHSAPAGADWTFAGRMGIVQYVIVPAGRSGERAYYERVVEGQCGAAPRCFLRFFTNTDGAEVALPLPDAIARQATALYQRSDKRGSAEFRWSCRMPVATPDCF